MPDDAEESQPLGVPADADSGADDKGAGAEQMPGIPTEGEPPASA